MHRRPLAALLALAASASAQELAPSWSAESDQVDSQLGLALASAGDVDGDGWSDVLVGAPNHDCPSGANAGRAFLYLGSPSGPAAAPAWSADGASAGAFFGWSVSAAGDVNADGFGDVLVGAPRASLGETREGSAYLYLGSAAGLAAAPAWSIESDQAEAQLGLSVSAAGDVNGDGFSDVLVAAPYLDAGEVDEGRVQLFLGSPAGLGASAAWSADGEQTDAWLGQSVSRAGDVDGDGFDDVLAGARRYDAGETDEGAAFLWLGSAAGLAATPAWTAESDQAGAELGQCVANAGDVNGDGYGDVLVGAHLYDAPESNEGAAFVYLGSAAGLAATPAWTAGTDQAGAEGGFAVACAGDVNGDGFADVLVGARFHEDDALVNEGRAFLYLGSSAGPGAAAAWSQDGDQAGALFGYALAGAGDADGDGYGDVLVGAPLADHPEPNEGRAFLYRGAPRLLADAPSWTIESDLANAQLGGVVARAGDVDGDGYEDVLLGLSNLASGRGEARLHRGSATGLSAVAAWTQSGAQDFAHFGSAVAGADVNGDGYDDVLVSQPFFSGPDAEEGRVYCYLGSPAGPAATAAWIVIGEQELHNIGTSIATGDFDGDGFGDVVVGASGGPTYVYYGSPSGLGATSPQPGFFAPTVASAGDVDGDGFPDLLWASGSWSGVSVRLFRGSAGGLQTSTIAWTSADSFPVQFGGAGDVNGDGYSDVLVGRPSYDGGETDEGRVLVYHGSSAGLGVVAAWTVEGEQANAGLGRGASAGDVNADGYGDVLVATAYHDGVVVDGGRAALHLGSPSGLGAAPAWSVLGTQSATRFGDGLDGADVNGDGYEDVLVGASQHDAGQVNEGALFVFGGNEARGGLVLTLQQRRADDSAPIAGLGLTAADGAFRVRCAFPRNLATFAWASPDVPRARLEWEVEPFGVPFDGEGLQRGPLPGVGLEPAGGLVTLDELVPGDPPSRFRRRSVPFVPPGGVPGVFHWRARVVTNNPLFPRSAWFSPSNATGGEALLRRP